MAGANLPGVIVNIMRAGPLQRTRTATTIRRSRAAVTGIPVRGAAPASAGDVRSDDARLSFLQ